jgi:hypothetical protein
LPPVLLWVQSVDFKWTDACVSHTAGAQPLLNSLLVERQAGFGEHRLVEIPALQAEYTGESLLTSLGLVSPFAKSGW